MMAIKPGFDDIEKKQINNLNQLVQRNRQQCPDRLGYRFLQDDGETSITYSQLSNEVNKLSVLISDHAKPGERVIIGASPGLEFVISFYACLQSGCIAVPLFPPINTLMATRFMTVIENAKPCLVVCDKKTVSQIKKGMFASKFLPQTIKEAFGLKETMVSLFQLMGKKRIKLISTERRSTVPVCDMPPYPATVDDTAFLQYTSGSTGQPKGVIISHGNLLDNMSIIKRVLHHRPGSHKFSWLPPYHDMGLIAAILEPLYAQIPSTLMSTLDFIYHPDSWMKYMSDYRCTTTGAPNFAFELASKKMSDELVQQLDLSCVEVIANGAEPINPQTIANFYKKFAPAGLKKGAVFPCYGLAESTVMASAAPILTEEKIIEVDSDQLANNKVFVGKGKKGISLVSSGIVQMETKIINQSNGDICAENEVGEIWLRGQSVAKGYYNDPEKTQATFHARLKGSPHLYLRTGDLGFLYQGELFVCGRIKDLIIIRGENYFPQDIELVISEAVLSLRKGCVIACSVNHNDEESLAIIAEVRKPMQKDDYEEVCATIRSEVTNQFFIQVAEIYLIQPKTIPKTSSGKLQRFAGKHAIEKQSLDYLYAWKGKDQDRDSSYAISVDIIDNQWWHRFNEASMQTKEGMLSSWLQTALASVLEHQSKKPLPINTSFFELGLDSVRLYEFKQIIDSGFSNQVIVDAQDLFKHDSIKKLSAWMMGHLEANTNKTEKHLSTISSKTLEQRLHKIPGVIKKVLGISRFEDVVKQVSSQEHISQKEIYQIFCQAFHLQYSVIQEADLSDIQSKPLIIVSNHPTGFNDSIVVPQSLLNECRFDQPIITLASHMMILKPFEPYLIPVDIYEESHINVIAYEQVLCCLKDCKPVLLFPSAEIGAYSKHRKQVIDPNWSDSVLTLRKKSDAYILPVFIDIEPIKWGWLFDKLPYKIRQYLLLRVAVSAAKHPYKIILKTPIPPNQPITIDKLSNLCNGR